MSCLGVHFALTKEEVETLKSLESDSDRVDHLQEEIEEKYFSECPEFKAESDKAWDAMHRLLSDGDLSYESGPEPLRFTVIGGTPIYFDDDYIMSLKSPEQVKKVSEAISKITKDEFKKRYEIMDEAKYGCPKSDEDFEYTWDWFTGVVELYSRAANMDRFVLFTADQ